MLNSECSDPGLLRVKDPVKMSWQDPIGSHYILFKHLL